MFYLRTFDLKMVKSCPREREREEKKVERQKQNSLKSFLFLSLRFDKCNQVFNKLIICQNISTLYTVIIKQKEKSGL